MSEEPVREAPAPRIAHRERRWVALVAGVLALGSIAFGIGRCSAPDATERPAVQQASPGAIWTCAMHPQIRSPDPGQCPICGMDLIPVEGGEDVQPAPNQVTLTERARALARIRTTSVRRIGASGTAVRLLGRVDYDETTLQTVTAWIGGRIDRLHVRTTGQRVRRGQVIATLYSPEVYAAQQDVIAARRQLERLAGSSELARTAAQAAADAARQRLALLGIPGAEIDRLESARTPSRQVAIRSPFGGTIIERLASEGAYVQTGAPLYRIADLSRLWVQLDAYESDLAQLTVGQTVELSVDAFPGELFEGRVAFVDPVIDRQRRTARVRVEVSNPDGQLRPGMFVEASVRAAAGEDAAQPLVLPASAPLFTGRRSIVYVEVAGAARPTYEARVVRLGPRVGDLYPVVAGLGEGERVVTHGAFALDADLQIRGGESMMMGGDDTTSGPYDQAIEVPEAFRQGLRSVLEPYLRMQEHLAADDLPGAKADALALASAVNDFVPSDPAAAVTAWRSIAEHLRMHAARASSAASIEAARGQFEPLSGQMARALRLFGNPMEEPLRLAFCPMAFDNRGAEWIQTDETIDNPYFGASMRTCGDVQSAVEPDSYLPAPRSEGAEGRAAPAAGGHRH